MTIGLSLILCCNLIPAVGLAEDVSGGVIPGVGQAEMGQPEIGQPEIGQPDLEVKHIINSFESLDNKDLVKTVKAGTTAAKLNFPRELQVIVNKTEFAEGETILLPVMKWVNKSGSKEYNSLVSGSYLFVPTFDDSIAIGEGVSLPEINVTVKRAYQNPKGYYQIHNSINLKDRGNYNLNIGRMGLKVLKVNNYFHIGNKYWPRYTYETRNKVRLFQIKKNIKATGIVDEKTWTKMGFTKDSWYTLGAYKSPMRINATSTKKECIEAMIGRARDYRGDDYVVGASGKPGQGLDCSGLVMQGLYAAGIDLHPINPVRHSQKEYEYESRNIFKSKKLKTISYNKKQRGDLVFYKNGAGRVNHIAIYLGNNKVIEAMPNKVVVANIVNSGHSRIAGIKRVFI